MCDTAAVHSWKIPGLQLPHPAHRCRDKHRRAWLDCVSLWQMLHGCALSHRMHCRHSSSMSYSHQLILVWCSTRSCCQEFLICPIQLHDIPMLSTLSACCEVLRLCCLCIASYSIKSCCLACDCSYTLTTWSTCKSLLVQTALPNGHQP